MISEIVLHPLFGVVTGLIGFLAGHRFAIWRDRRLETNKAADLFFSAMRGETKSPCPTRGRPTDEEIELFRRHLGWIDRRCFDRALRRYEDAKKKNMSRDEAGAYFYSDEAHIREAASAVLAFAKRK